MDAKTAAKEQEEEVEESARHDLEGKPRWDTTQRGERVFPLEQHISGLFRFKPTLPLFRERTSNRSPDKAQRTPYSFPTSNIC
tara:strand:+ start:120 stop:368 length:249 start_codon:yes stop_codon:yes gene_type:complete